MDRLERAIQADILTLCQRPWIELHRTGNDRGKSKSLPPGWPDITGWKKINGHGILVFIEVKKPGEKLRPEQEDILSRAEAAGCIVGVATSVEEAFKILGL